MRRREFILALGGAAAWPLTARAQQPAMPVVGHLNSGSPDGLMFFVTTFRKGLKENGYIEGQNVAVEYRWAEGQTDRLQALATDLINRHVAAIAADTRSALVLKATNTTIPVVFNSGGDPVKLGLVDSLNRPGRNMTGVSFLTTAAVAKRLDLLRELIPTATQIGYLVNPDNFNIEIEEVQAAGRELKLQVLVLDARSERDFDQAFATLRQRRVDALFVGGDPLFLYRRDQIAALAARYAIPTMYNLRQYALAGGLISYGASIEDSLRQAGVYVGRILKGAKPADLPIMQSTTFELVINLKTAKALGLKVPQTLLVAADELIE
jgi:putative ABC transport system substrate-binding protein